MMTNKRHGEGTCPRCGGANLEYYDSDQYGEYIINDVSCNDCDFTFREFEKVIYDGYSYEDEDGEHEFNAEDDEI